MLDVGSEMVTVDKWSMWLTTNHRSNTTDMILAQILIADVVDPGPNQTSVASPGSS